MNFITVTSKESKEKMSVNTDKIIAVGVWRDRSMIIGESHNELVGAVIDTQHAGSIDVLELRENILLAIGCKEVVVNG